MHPGFGRIDCLVNNAGGQFTAPAEDITPNGWRAVRRLNLDAPWFLTQRVAKRWMIANGGGRVISVVLCPERGIEGMAHSSAARAGMGALTRTPGDGVGPLRDRARVRRAGLDRHRGRARLRAGSGRGRGHDADERLGGADEVGDLIAFLASPAAAYITGPTIAIDGGVDLNEQRLGVPGPR